MKAIKLIPDNFNVLDWTSGFVAAKRSVFEKVPLTDSVYGDYL